jgi:hypothetical protein
MPPPAIILATTSSHLALPSPKSGLPSAPWHTTTSHHLGFTTTTIIFLATAIFSSHRFQRRFISIERQSRFGNTIRGTAVLTLPILEGPIFACIISVTPCTSY